MRSNHPARVACIVALSCAATALAAPESPAREARTITVDGSSALVKLWTAPDGRERYAVALDGARFAPAADVRTQVELVHGSFDPLAAAAPAVDPRFRADDDTHLAIVQFVTPPLESYRAVLREHGATVRFFLPYQSHVVQLDAEARAAVAALPFVRWVGSYEPAWRMEPFLLEHYDALDVVFPLRRYNVMLVESSMETKQRVADRIRAMGGIVDRAHAGKFLLEATLAPGQLREIVRWDDVLFVDRWSDVETDMDMIRSVSGANFIASVGGYEGTGVNGEVLDIGFNLDHVDFATRPLVEHTNTSNDSHGASTSGIVFGSGSGDPTAKGLLPKGRGYVAAWSQVSTGQPRYDHTGELVQYPWNAVFQTASVGSQRTTQYTSISADTDAMLFDFDIVHLQSQSNAGNQDSRPQAWAKNIISVGGVRSQNSATRADDCWCGAASIGPAADGRIKPDLAHFNDQIRTVTCCGPNDYTSFFGGTSGATPVVAGLVGLFFQMWDDGIFGNPVDPMGRVFENRSHMTTAKAMMINSADSYPFSGAGADLTRTHQGWGTPDLVTMWDRRDRMFIVDEDDVVAPFETVEYTVNVPVGEEALRITMVYADPPGTPGASVHRVNDLSLRATSPDGVVYWGNNGLHTGNWSTPNGSPNDRDTVENVFVDEPRDGAWTIEVIAHEINEDGHVETPALDADFALVVSGVQPGCDADIDDDGAVGFTDLQQILTSWGPCVDCAADLDESGDVGLPDLLLVLAAWGPC